MADTRCKTNGMDDQNLQKRTARTPRKVARRPGRRAAARPATADPAGSKSEQTRARILDAAAFVFARKGYADARLSDIARTARMQTGSLYYHFNSREDLVAEVMRVGVQQVFRTVRERLEALPPDTGDLERLGVALETHLLCLIEHNDYARANTRLSGQIPRRLQLLHAANEQEYGRLWRSLLRDGQTTGALRPDVNMSAIRMFLLGAMAWSVEWFKPENGPGEMVARDFAKMAVDGLRARPPRAD